MYRYSWSVQCMLIILWTLNISTSEKLIPYWFRPHKLISLLGMHIIKHSLQVLEVHWRLEIWVPNAIIHKHSFIFMPFLTYFSICKATGYPTNTVRRWACYETRNSTSSSETLGLQSTICFLLIVHSRVDFKPISILWKLQQK